MKRHIIHKLTAPMMIAAGILIGVSEALLAQNQSQTKPGSQKTQSHTNHGATTNSAKGKNAASNNKMMSSKSDEAMFVKKASEANLAEIKLGELAMEKGSTNEVREYAQMMIKDHTMAQTQLAQIVSNYEAVHNHTNTRGDADKMSTLGGTGNTTGSSMARGKTNGQYNSSLPLENNDDADVEEGEDKKANNPSGGTTATGSTYASGNGNGAAATANKTQGRSADGAASNNTSNNNQSGNKAGNDADANATTNPGMSPTQVGRGGLTEPNNTAPVGSNNEQARTANDGTGGGGPGANSGGTTSSMTNGRVSRATPDNQDDRQGQSNTASGANSNGVQTISNTMAYDMPTELSAEHKALRDKLAKLSGAEFDREYLQAMVKDHAKSVALFEKQSMADNAKDNPKDDQLKQYAANMLPHLKKHHEQAQMLLGGGKIDNSPAKPGIK